MQFSFEQLLAQGLPGGEQGPAQGPNTPVKRYGDSFMPYGPGGGGLPATPFPLASTGSFIDFQAPGMMMAGAPRYIRSSPPGGIINKAPHIDSPYIDKAIERGWQPMPAPPPRGPQLPGFV